MTLVWAHTTVGTTNKKSIVIALNMRGSLSFNVEKQKKIQKTENIFGKTYF
jgi:hypothetical protein